MAVALTAINTGIHDTFVSDFVFPPALVAELVKMTWQDYGDITEGVANTPTIQFYWENMATVSSGGDTDRQTFGGSSQPERIKDFEFRLDLYLDRSAHMHKVFGHMLPLVDAVNDVFEAQNAKPYFGVAGIKSFTFECERGQIEYSKQPYPVVQWLIGIRVF